MCVCVRVSSSKYRPVVLGKFVLSVVVCFRAHVTRGALQVLFSLTMKAVEHIGIHRGRDHQRVVGKVGVVLRCDVMLEVALVQQCLMK